MALPGPVGLQGLRVGAMHHGKQGVRGGSDGESEARAQSNGHSAGQLSWHQWVMAPG